MLVRRTTLRDFRNYERAEVELGAGLTVAVGANGAGKTNLLEALYFGCTARSCRTSNERELVRAGEKVARVTVETVSTAGETHRLEVGLEPGEAKRVRVDGAPAPGGPPVEARPLVSVFLPERLELVKGAPSVRRAHLDQLVAALWPARSAVRGAYGRALAQRNALLLRVRARAAAPELLDAWDAELARLGAELMANRAEAASLVAPAFAERAGELGLAGVPELRYRPRSAATDAAGLRAELEERRGADVERGFSAHGPHRDDVGLLHGGRSLRSYGSQGQQRLAVLALLFGERDVLLGRHRRPPLMLLDDVMAELDRSRRERLAELLRAGGQALVTATDAEHVPGALDAEVVLLQVVEGSVAARPPARAAA